MNDDDLIALIAPDIPDSQFDSLRRAVAVRTMARDDRRRRPDGTNSHREGPRRTMKVAVLGAGGLLGRHVVEEMARRGREVLALDHAACAIEDARAVASALAGCALAVNCAAFTDVDGAESEPDRSFAINALGAENVARATAAAGAVVLHVSTDFVFGGRLDRPQDEFDLPEPLSLYARSKRAGELLVERANPRSHVVRVQGLYGRGGRNFASRLSSLLREGKRLRLDGERRVQPTSARAAARAIADIAATDRWGTWHASCRGATTWAGFATRLAARLDLSPTWEAVPSAALALRAPRPPNCLLEHRRLALCGLPPLPTWEEALEESLKERDLS